MSDAARQASSFVKAKIARLLASGNGPVVRATLAELRRGVGKVPGSVPRLWSITFEGLPESLTRKGGEPTYGEWAVHSALTLFALHQQGKDPILKCMSQDGASLGGALRKMSPTEEEERRVKRRFDAAATADSLAECAHHLRGLVQLLKAEDLPLDYPEMAADLFRFQFPEGRDWVRLKWGRDFYRWKQEAGSIAQTTEKEG